MKAKTFAPILQSIVVAAFLNVVAFKQTCAAQAADLTLMISGDSQSVVLTWFGEIDVPHQLEASPDLTAFTNLGLVITGSGGFIDVTQTIAGQTRRFFRLKRLAQDPTTPVFDAPTGTLTITGNDQDNIIVVRRDAAGLLGVENSELKAQPAFTHFEARQARSSFRRPGCNSASAPELIVQRAFQWNPTLSSAARHRMDNVTRINSRADASSCRSRSKQTGSSPRIPRRESERLFRLKQLDEVA
jgi:hypothetical protein